MSQERQEHRFLWFIENYNYYWCENIKLLSSPTFLTLDNSDWNLDLYPHGESEEDDGFISVFLRRGEENLSWNITFRLNYELSVLATDGSEYSAKEFSNTFEFGSRFGARRLVRIDELLLHENNYLPHGTLTVSCKMWTGKGNIRKIQQTSARTRIGIEKTTFLHVVQNFSKLEPNQKMTKYILPVSEVYSRGTTSCLYLEDDSCCEGKISIEITLPDREFYFLLDAFFFVLDVQGNIKECAKLDNRFDTTRRSKYKLHLSLTREAILMKKSEYLPKDDLTLLCKFTSYRGVDFSKIEEEKRLLPLLVFNQTHNMTDKYRNNVAERLSTCVSALDNLTTIFNNQSLSDVELITETNSFKAHKVILCARSPVFKNMFSNDMAENNTDIVQIDDLEDETVQQLLLFLYSDNLKNLKWESAIKLYYAADKYEVEKLKAICSSYLVKNMSTENVIELLLLADTHNDSDLTSIAENFILEHEYEVFGSDEWEKLIGTNPQLVIKTVHLKYKREK